MAQWKFAKAISENEAFNIDGINIWNHYWHCVNKKVEVERHYEANVYFFKEYQIINNDKTINFVAGEFINSKVGIYLKDDLSDTKL